MITLNIWGCHLGPFHHPGLHRKAQSDLEMSTGRSHGYDVRQSLTIFNILFGTRTICSCILCNVQQIVCTELSFSFFGSSASSITVTWHLQAVKVPKHGFPSLLLCLVLSQRCYLYGGMLLITICWVTGHGYKGAPGWCYLCQVLYGGTQPRQSE